MVLRTGKPNRNPDKVTCRRDDAGDGRGDGAVAAVLQAALSDVSRGPDERCDALLRYATLWRYAHVQKPVCCPSRDKI